MSNTERQRRFRERNPGYYARIQAGKRSSAKRTIARLKTEAIANQALLIAAEQAALVITIPPVQTPEAPTAC